MRHLLMSEWDPIGVSDEPMASDEYDGYIGPLLEMLERGPSAPEIVDYLRWVEVERMGLVDLQGDPLRPLAKCRGVALALQELWTRCVLAS